MWVYACVGLGILGLVLVMHYVLKGLDLHDRMKVALRDNEALICENRKLKNDNRKLTAKVYSKEYQVNSRWEQRYEEATRRISELERQLKIKDELLKAVEGKVAV